MFLTPAEIESLTGYARPKAQAKWLTGRGYPFEVGGDGEIKVLRDYVMRRLGGKISGQHNEPTLRLG